MMIGNSRKGYHQGKQEGDRTTTTDHHNTINNSIEKLYSKAASSSMSRQWSAGMRNPRIVRVSRLFGGKDRHSKVCTIRGLRDRRIRLSVPTAIQLYDLQDRLGVSQPSKVIDWLIEATKLEIDKLPPLQIPGFPQFLHHQQTLLLPHHHEPSNSHPPGALYDANFIDAVSRMKGMRDQDHQRSGSVWEKGKWVMKTNNEEEDEDDDGDDNGGIGGNISAQKNLLPVTYYNNNNNSSYSYHSGPSSNLSLFGSHGFFPNNSQVVIDPAHNSSAQFQFPPNSSAATVLPSSLFGPYYAPYVNMTNNLGEIQEPTRVQLNHLQLLSSSSHYHHHHHHQVFSPSLKTLPLPTTVLPFTSSLLDSDHNDKDTTDRS